MVGPSGYEDKIDITAIAATLFIAVLQAPSRIRIQDAHIKIFHLLKCEKGVYVIRGMQITQILQKKLVYAIAFLCRGQAGSLFVTTMHYKPENRRFDSPLHNPSGRTMTLRSTQPLTEMRTRNITYLRRGEVVKAADGYG